MMYHEIEKKSLEIQINIYVNAWRRSGTPPIHFCMPLLALKGVVVLVVWYLSL